MSAKTDEQVLYESYLKLAVINAKSAKSAPITEDKKMVAGIMGKFPIILLRLYQDSSLTVIDIQKSLFKAKNYMVQLNKIKKRNPSCIQSSLERSMESMLHAMCKREAAMVELLRLQETGGERIDLEKIFEKKTNICMLGNKLARDIIKDAMNDETSTVGEKSEECMWFITETGKKYHVKDCVYCKGKNLINATNAMIYNQKLEPCKCIERTQKAEDHNCVTAFIDESVHDIKWNEAGKMDKASSFSYIICWGNLLSENYIREENIIAKGVDYCNVKDSTSRVTEAAIGKVLISLLYDYEFTGDVQMYIDNKSVVKTWSDKLLNSKLANQFKSVSVSFVPRERNKMADKLGREKMFLCLNKDVYNSIVVKSSGYDKLNSKYEKVVLEKQRVEKELEFERQNTIWNKITGWFRKLYQQFIVVQPDI